MLKKVSSLRSLQKAQFYLNLEDAHLNTVIVTVNLMSIVGEVPQAFIVHRENPRHPRTTKPSLSLKEKLCVQRLY